MRRLIWGIAGRTYHIVGNLMHWLICESLDYRAKHVYIILLQGQIKTLVQINGVLGYQTFWLLSGQPDKQVLF